MPGAKKNSDTQSDTKRKFRSKNLNLKLKTKGLPDEVTGISPAKSMNELLTKTNTKKRYSR